MTVDLNKLLSCPLKALERLLQRHPRILKRTDANLSEGATTQQQRIDLNRELQQNAENLARSRTTNSSTHKAWAANRRAMQPWQVGAMQLWQAGAASPPKAPVSWTFAQPSPPLTLRYGGGSNDLCDISMFAELRLSKGKFDGSSLANDQHTPLDVAFSFQVVLLGLRRLGRRSYALSGLAARQRLAQGAQNRAPANLTAEQDFEEGHRFVQEDLATGPDGSPESSTSESKFSLTTATSRTPIFSNCACLAHNFSASARQSPQPGRRTTKITTACSAQSSNAINLPPRVDGDAATPPASTSKGAEAGNGTADGRRNGAMAPTPAL
eukprot:CAMPEP_0204166016 /NCGR_PEP_ID=MMETSP0361-20130328/38649_1 /ASSEMBLY_ACC=CAM_ASM_000343 /TAXON_ID=268821 /ORGANISM="Scrippsiella Hangoei, Strain SHTV-5" /LENGTH=324 /DNA_ID=CAMNT_0051123099 /DNA_START=169 /DNA_END=1146 /DNA_ORIENTATION=-